MNGIRALITAVLIASAAQTRLPCQPETARTTGAWTKRRPVNQGAVFAGTLVGRNGRIYVISETTQYDVNLTDAVHVYDPKNDMWAGAAPIPTPRTCAGAALGPDGRIYMIGGQDRERRMNVVEAYDPVKDSWIRLRPMPTPRDALQAAAAIGSDGRMRIYAIGGRGALHGRVRDNFTTVEAYDPTTDTWSDMRPMPTRRPAQAATLGPGGRIYVVGGTNEEMFATTVLEIYDPVKDAWSTGAPMPYGQECASATCTSGPDGEILVFGGWGKGKIPVRNAAAYNSRTNRWRLLPPMPTAKAACGAVTIKSNDNSFQAFILGGTGEDGSGNIHPSTAVETSVDALSLHPSE